MALILETKPLEERLGDFISQDLASLSHSLAEKKQKSIDGPYHKYKLVERIADYFWKPNQGQPLSFGGSYKYAKGYLSGINKEPLKAVEKGMRTEGIPRDFLARLDDFEKMYFFAGVNALADTSPDFAGLTAYDIASRYIIAGIYKMENLHNSILESNPVRRTVRRGHRLETYSQRWQAPHAVEVCKNLAGQEMMSLFAEEKMCSAMQKASIDNPELADKVAEIGERISLKLESLPRPQIIALARIYGPQRVGVYAFGHDRFTSFLNQPAK